ncbi:MAG: hypothetical protein ABIV12_10985 [Dokdonella sp.]
MQRTSARERDSLLWWAVLVAAVVAGIVLRLYQLRSQVLIDDEWHAVRMLIRADASAIATHFGFADYCIPLTLYFRWLYEHAALNEWQMHLPSLVAGVALLIAASTLLRQTLSLPARAIWVALLAISPVLIYFSRIARPYALVAILGVVAVLAFRAWWRGDSRRGVSAAIYLVATFLAGWLHLLSLVFTLWPFAYYGVFLIRDLSRPSTRENALRPLLRFSLLALATLASLAAALVPPLVKDAGAMIGKAGSSSVSIDSLYRGVLMQFGVTPAWVGVVMFALLVFGVRRLARRDRDFTTLLVSMMLVGTVVIALARPAWIVHQAVMVRYCVVALPFILLFVAEGYVGVLERVRVAYLAPLVTIAAMTGLYFAGPFPAMLYWPNQFMADASFQFDFDPTANPYATMLQLGPVSPFFLELAKRPPGSVTLMETPASFNSNFTPDPWLQAIHRQKLKFALASPVCGTGDWDEYPYTATGVRFRSVAQLSDVLDGASYGADYLVLRMRPWTVPPGIERPSPDMPACVEKVRQRLGEPTYRDEQITVFSLRGANPGG